MEWSERLAGAEWGREFTSVSLGIPAGLLRYAVYSLFLVAALMFYVWSRVDVRTAAADLDLALRKMETLQVEGGHLGLELSMRRDLNRVEQAALALGLSGDVEIQEVVLP